MCETEYIYTRSCTFPYSKLECEALKFNKKNFRKLIKEAKDSAEQPKPLHFKGIP